VKIIAELLERVKKVEAHQGSGGAEINKAAETLLTSGT